MVNQKVLYIPLLLGCLIGLCVAVYVLQYYKELSARADYLYWDPSAHAYYGEIITSDFINFDFLNLLRDVNGQVLWPPLHSFFEVPFMFVLGRNFYAASICSAAFLILFFPAITLTYQNLTTDWFGWITLMILASTSPYLLGFGSMPMLEIFGGVLSLVCLILYFRNSKLFPLSLAALFFLKYNYCFYVLLPIIALVIWQKFKEIEIKSAFSSIGRFEKVVVFYLIFLLIILVTGGFRVGSLSVRGIGNPLYALLIVITIRLIHKKRFVPLWHKIRGTGWEYFFIPVYLWLLIPIPNRVKTLISFSINQPLSGQSPSDLGYFTFYLHALKVYFNNPYLLIFCVAAFVIALVLYRKEQKVIFLMLFFVLPFALMTANQNKQERYLFTFIPAIWLLCAYLVGNLKNIVLKAGITLLVALCAFVFYKSDELKSLVSWPFIPSNVDKPVDYISKIVGDATQIRILGVRNDMSPSLIMHHIMKQRRWHSRPIFKWELEKNPPSGTNVVLINTEIQTNDPIQVKHFPGGINIAHFKVP